MGWEYDEPHPGFRAGLRVARPTGGSAAEVRRSGVSAWGRRTFGEPCRGCGYSWAIELDEARTLVTLVSSRLSALLAEAVGDERHPSLSWSVTAYVAHIGDNLRIWAERVAGASNGGTRVVATYDENSLARARNYEGISLPGALWTLTRSARDWADAFESAHPGLVMEHPERGPVQLEDVIRTNAHDVAHHIWDIERTLASSSAPGH